MGSLSSQLDNNPQDHMLAEAHPIPIENIYIDLPIEMSSQHAISPSSNITDLFSNMEDISTQLKTHLDISQQPVMTVQPMT